MTSVHQARESISKFLRDLGYNPTNVILNTFHTSGNQGNWELKGNFQDGFLGTTLNFYALFDPSKLSLVLCEVTSSSEESV